MLILHKLIFWRNLERASIWCWTVAFLFFQTELFTKSICKWLNRIFFHESCFSCCVSIWNFAINGWYILIEFLILVALSMFALSDFIFIYHFWILKICIFWIDQTFLCALLIVLNILYIHVFLRIIFIKNLNWLNIIRTYVSFVRWFRRTFISF